MGLSQEQRATVIARVRDNVAERIEQGDIPSVQIPEARQVKTELQRGVER